jgi:hypothetical protein
MLIFPQAVRRRAVVGWAEGENEGLEMAQQAVASDMDYCGSGFCHLDRVARPGALAMKNEDVNC